MESFKLNPGIDREFVNGRPPYNRSEQKIFDRTMEDHHREYFENLAKNLGVSVALASRKNKYPGAERSKAKTLAKERIMRERIREVNDKEAKERIKNSETYTWQRPSNPRRR